MCHCMVIVVFICVLHCTNVQTVYGLIPGDENDRETERVRNLETHERV